MSQVSLQIEAPPEGGQSRRGFVAHTLRHRPAAVIGTTILVLVALGAILAPWIAPYPLHEQVGPVFGHPSWPHLLGLDDGGIDMVTLLMWGARVSLVVGFAATLVGSTGQPVEPERDWHAEDYSGQGGSEVGPKPRPKPVHCVSSSKV